MKKTRHAGIYVLKKNKYLMRVKRKDPRTGKPREVQRTINGTIDDALAARLGIVAEIEDGQIAVERQTVQDYATAWFERNEKRWAYSTRLRHAEHLDLLIDDLGDLYLDCLLPRDVRDFLKRLAEDGYKAHSINGALRVARTMLRDAKADLGLVRDPCERVSEVPVEDRDDDDGNVLTGEELYALFASLESPWNLVAFTMATTGLRFCHVSALRWEDIDLDTGVVRPRLTQYRGKVSRIGRKTKKKAPKSIPLCKQLVVMLADHRRWLVGEQHPGLAEGWVFPRPNGKVYYSGDLGPKVKKAMTTAGITKRFTPHGLRRSFNNLARQEGADAIVIRSIMGHSTAEMTEHYSHVPIGEKRGCIDKVVGRIRESGTPGGTPESETKEAEQ